MKFSSQALAVFLLSTVATDAFSIASKPVSNLDVSKRVGSVFFHGQRCVCPACAGARSTTALRQSEVVEGEAPAATEAVPAATEEVPSEVVALDGVQSTEEAHNADRPARKSLRKKGPKGKPLSEFKVGETVKATVRTMTTYGAFMDIGASTDGLLHISQLAVGFVSNVADVLQVGQEVEVRITNIDEGKNQVALSMLTEAQVTEAKEASSRPRQPRGDRASSDGPSSEQRSERSDRPERSNNKRENTNNRRDDSAVLAQLVQKGWDSEKFVEGTVVSTVDFGAFVRINANQLNPEIEGEFDGLVHISALTSGRANSVTSIVNVDDKVQVRVKGVADRKVSLTMVSLEDEQAKNDASGSGAGPSGEGNAQWKEHFIKVQENMPVFKNRPAVVDLRK